MAMEQQVLDTVGRFYSRRARHPLHALEPGAIVVTEPTGANDPRAPHRSWVLWMVVLADRAVLVASAEYTATLCEAVAAVGEPAELIKPETIADLTTRCRALAGGSRDLQPYMGRKYCCDSGMLRPVHDANVQRLTPGNASGAMHALRSVGIPDDPAYLLAEDAAFAYYLDGDPVAFAATHPAGDMSGSVGDVMVGTLEGYRRRGYGKAVISATTAAVVARGKVAVWGMSHDNVGAMRTASSIGYQQYCELLELR
jgi:GNAT superfamily N-acetyltransferase